MFGANLRALFLVMMTISFLPGIELKELTKNDFDDWPVNQKYLFVLYYSSKSCKRCDQVLDDWKSFENRFVNNNLFSEIKIGHIDCNKQRDICSKENLNGQLPLAKLYVEINKLTRIEIDYESNEYDRNTLDMFLLKQITRFGFHDQPNQTPKSDVGTDNLNDDDNKQDTRYKTESLKAIDGLYELTDDNSAEFLENGQHFVNFYAPWCLHCQNLKPKWQMIAKSLEENELVKISQINCQENIDTCKNRFKIKEYPTLLWILNGKIIAKYKGLHEITQIKTFINSQLTDFELDKLLKKYTDSNSDTDEIEFDYRKRNSNIITLNDDNFKTTIDSGWTFVHFTVPWSKHCRQMKTEWNKFINSITANMFTANKLKIAKVDCSLNDKICTQEKIDSYPTLLLYHNGDRLEEYMDDTIRTSDSFLQFLQKNIDNNNLKIEL